MTITHRWPPNATITARTAGYVLVTAWQLPGAQAWYADDPATRTLPGYHHAPQVIR